MDVAFNVVPSLVADLITEAYVDNITWYDVIFLPPSIMTSSMTSIPAWSRWPPDELGPGPLYVGPAAVEQTDEGQTDDRPWRQHRAIISRVAFYRTHLDIFGDAWPHWIRTASQVVSYIKDVYAVVEDSSPAGPSFTLYDDAIRNDRAWLRRQVSINKLPLIVLKV